MKQKYLFITGILAFVLVFGMTVIGCDDPTNKGGRTDSALNGTWIGYGAKMILDNGSLEVKDEEDDVPYYKGTYTANDGNLTMTITHLYFSEEDLEYFPFDAPGYYTESEMKAAFRAFFVALAEELGYDPADIEAEITAEVDEMWDDYFRSSFVPQTGTYSVSGSTLTITIDGDVSTFTKQP